MKILSRQKLNIINQTRSNIFGLRGQFTPDSKPIEFDGFGNCGEFATIRLTQPTRWAVLIPWDSTGLEVQEGERLNQIAIRQMQVLTSSNLKALPGKK